MPKHHAILLAIAAFVLFTACPRPAAAFPFWLINGCPAVEAPDSETQNSSDVKRIDQIDSQFSRFTDYANGFSILFPASMEPDVSLSPVRVVLSDGRAKIEIYRDDLSGTASDADDYLFYGRRFAANTRDHQVTEEATIEVAGLQTRVMKWTRRKLSRIEGDRNHYVSAEYVVSPRLVYTIFIKSDEPAAFADTVLKSFQLVERRGMPRFSRRQKSSITPLNAAAQNFYDEFFGPDSALRWGIFEPSAPASFNRLDALENFLSYSFPVILRYQMIDEALPVDELRAAYARGKYVELTLQTVHSDQVTASPLVYNGQDNESLVYDILDGLYDDYFNEYAQSLKAFGQPVLFRLDNEMNGDWCWYSAHYTAKDADIYRELWRYIYRIFAKNGVTNAIWVWNPNDLSRPEFKWNHFLMYYPGDEYVDVIGLTGYNTGTYFPGERWREFAAIYDPLYCEYAELFDKPLMITEFGCSSFGGDKAAWIQQMFDHISQYPRLKLAIWWSGTDYDAAGQPARIYRLDETPEILDVFRRNLRHFP